MSVNGESLRDATHDEAVRALKRAGKVVDLEGRKLRKCAHTYSSPTRFYSVHVLGCATHLAAYTLSLIAHLIYVVPATCFQETCVRAYKRVGLFHGS